MKNILLLITLIVAANTTSAQSIQLDTPRNMAYAEINPQTISWIKGSPSVTRLYINITNLNLMTYTTFGWYLMYPVVVDPETTNYVIITQGALTLPINPSISIDTARKKIFNYVADSMQINVSFR